MNSFRADLHCHSTFSDGTNSIQEIIQLAKERGLMGLSITDHDTTDAYPEALQLAEASFLKMIPGVEFSAFFGNDPIHILGYSYDLKSDAIKHLVMRHKQRRHKRNLLILEKLKKLGIHIEESELNFPNHPTIGRPHIALALMKKNIVSSITEAFDRFLGDEKPAYVSGEKISVEETVEIIHQAKGIAILAHPHLIKKRSLIKKILNLPFDGLEGYYASFSMDKEREWIEIAQKKGWIVTGGSDFHGQNKPQNLLGTSWVNFDTFNLLYSHYSRLN